MHSLADYHLTALLLWPERADLRMQIAGGGSAGAGTLLLSRNLKFQTNATPENRSSLITCLGAVTEDSTTYPAIIRAILLLQDYALFTKWMSGHQRLLFARGLKVEVWIIATRMFGFAKCESMYVNIFTPLFSDTHVIQV